MKIKIFISYSDIDKKKVTQITKIFEDVENIELVIIANAKSELMALTEKVADGIKEADYFIPIITRNSISTQWINQEIGYATCYHQNTKKKPIIIPIVEKQIMGQLKGFIHKELDISFSFEGNVNIPKSESIKFKRTVLSLKAYLMDKNFKNQLNNENIRLSNILLNKQFKFTYNSETKRSKIIEFSPDGTFAKGGNNNEFTWEIKDDKLIIKNFEGKLYSSFIYNKKDNKLYHTNDNNTISLRNQFFEPIDI